jgi:hypothetical protein
MNAVPIVAVLEQLNKETDSSENDRGERFFARLMTTLALHVIEQSWAGVSF